MSEQSQGSMNGPSGEYAPNPHFNQYTQQNMRGGYSQPSMPGQIPNRPGIGGSPGSNTSMMPPGYSNNHNQQRFIMGSNMPQQGGTTPTLNRLLQNPNGNQRFQSGYADYNMGQQKGGQDISQNYSNQGWGNTQRPGNPYPQPQAQGNQNFRNQGQMYGGAQGYTQQTGQYGQFSPNSNQRFPGQGKPAHVGMGQQYNQQMSQNFGQQNNFGPHSYIPQPNMSQNSHQGTQMSPSQPSPHPTPPPNQSPAPPHPSPGPQHKALSEEISRPSSRQSDTIPHTNGIDGLKDESNDSSIHSYKQDACLPSSDEQQHPSNGNNNLDNNLKQTTIHTENPTSHSQHPSVQRPIPSPAGSTGSRSNTPASITGNQSGSPMPPRPPSNQVDGPGQVASNMSNQGYNQHIMPPPMGHTYGGQGKVPQNMMGGPQMGSYSQPYSTQQGGYNRGMSGYGNQQSFNGPNQIGGNPVYGANMNRNMPGNYSNQYGSHGMSIGNQYGQYGGQGQSNIGPSSKMGPSPSVGPNHMTQNVNVTPNSSLPPSSNMTSGPNPSVGMGPNSSNMIPGSNSNSACPTQPIGGPSPGASSNASISPTTPISKNTPPHQSSATQVSMNNSPKMPGPDMQSSGHKGAQAAAHAAMIAAANQSQTNTRPSFDGMQGAPAAPPPSSSGQGPMMSSQPQQQQRGMYGQYPPPQQSGSSQSGYNNQGRGPPNMMDNNSGYPPPSGVNTSQLPPNLGDMNSGMMGGGQMSTANTGNNNSMLSSGQPSHMGGNPMGQGPGMNGMPPHMSRSNTLPPNAVAPSNGPINTMGPPQMGPPMGPPPMGPPNTVPSNSGHFCKPLDIPHMDSNIDMKDIKTEQKSAISIDSSVSGDCVTTTTQSMNTPITNSTPIISCNNTFAPEYRPIKSEDGSQDESSQDSVKFKSDVKREMKQESTSHPATPASVAQSPSMGSQPEDFDNVSSPSWPGTPNPSSGQSKTVNEILQRQCEMGEEPERRPWLERLFAFMEERGSPIQVMPTISKNSIDLYRLYILTKEKGGLMEVTKQKKWREISTSLNIGSSSSAGFTLKKNYCRYIFSFECKYELGGIDPAPILAQVEAPQKKESKRAGGPEYRQGFDGYGMHHPNMPVDMHQGPMMPPNVSMMPPNSGVPPYGQQGMMPNQGMMGNQSMMGNQNMMHNQGLMGNQGMMSNQSMIPPNQGMIGNQGMMSGPSMMGGQGMMGNQMQSNVMPGNQTVMGNNNMMNQGGGMGPSSSMGSNMPNTQVPPQMRNNRGGINSSTMFNDSSYDQDSSKYPPGGLTSQQMPPYSSAVQQPPHSGMSSNSFGYSNRHSVPGTTPPFSSSSAHGISSSFSNEGAQQNNTGSFPAKPGGQESFNNSQAPFSSNRPPSQPFSSDSSNQGNSSNTPVSSHQQISRPQAPGMMPPSSQSGQEPNVPNRFGSPLQATPQRPPTPCTPQDSRSNTPQTQQPAPTQSAPITQPGQQTPVQGYPSNQRPMYHGSAQPTSQGQDNYPQGFAQGAANSPGPAMYPGSKPVMYGPPHKPMPDYPRLGMQSYPSSNYGERNMAGSFPPYGPPSGPSLGIGPQDNMHSDMRRDTWPMNQQRYGSQPPTSIPPGASTNMPPNSMPSGPSNLPPSGPGMIPGGMPPQSGSMTPGGGVGMLNSSGASPYANMYQMNRMPPQRPDNKPGYFPPSMPKMQGQKSMGSAPFPPKKEVSFPVDSVEATQPQLSKRKRLSHRHIGPVDPWRLMMALRSGMLVETSWALDVLTVLLFDESTVVYFGLQHLPGLLDALLDHFRCYLIQIFGEDFEHLELQCNKNTDMPALESHCSNCEEKQMNTNDDVVTRGVKRKLPVDIPDEEKLKQQGNFTLRTRCGKSVKIESDSSDHDIAFDDKCWDKYCNFRCSKGDFELGKGDISCHINTHLESENSIEFLKRRFFRHPPDSNINVHTMVNELIHVSDKDNNLNDIVAPSLLTKCDSEPRETSVQGHKIDASLPIKVEKMDHIDDHCKAEQSSNCSSDSGIHVKSETSEMSDTQKLETDETESEQVVIKTEKIGDKPNSPNVDVVKLENGNEELKEFKYVITDCNESDKQYLCKLKSKMDRGNEDNEEYRKDEMPLCKLKDSQEELSRRCICVSNIFRSLSFIPGNDREMARHRGLMIVLGKLLLYNHKHMKRSTDQRTFDKEIDTDLEDSIDETTDQWWWPTLDTLRENMLVISANISGQLNLSIFPEEICMPILDGLLHWAVCPSAYAQDAMPTMSSNSVLSPQRLVLETLCKLCVTEINVDLILATPPFSRIVTLFGNLIKLLADDRVQVTREFSVVLLSFLVQGDSSAARAIALQHPAISLLLDFIETAEQNAHKIFSSHGVHALRDNPEMVGTTPDMLRKAAKTLHHLAKVPENRSLFIPKQDRLLNLVMSQVLDKKVVSSLSSVLLHCSMD